MLFQNLRNFVRNIPSKYILLIIVALGFLLRVNNLTIGFPILYVSNDEAIYHLSALNMIASKTLFTLGNYGPLGAYVQLPFLVLAYAVMFLGGKIHSLANMEFLLLTQEGYLLFIPRVISALFGTLGILAVYSLAKDLLKNKGAALWSALIFAVSFNLVHISHLGRGWTPAIFFNLIAVKFALAASKEKKDSLKNTLISFTSVALAFGFHQLSGLIIVLVLLILIMPDNKSRRLLSKDRVLGLMLFFFLAMFFNWLSLGGNFLKVLEPQNPTVGLINFPSLNKGFGEILAFYIERGTFWDLPKNLILSDGMLVALFVFFFLKRKVDNFSRFFLIFIVFNYLLIALILPTFLRYFLISVALMPIFAGWTISELMRKKQLFFAAILVLVLSFNSVYWNFLLLKNPTFDQLREWLAVNVPAETAIAAPNLRNLGYVPSTEAADVIRLASPGYYRRASQLIGDSYPSNVRNIIYFDQFKAGSKVKNANMAAELYPIKYVIDWYTTGNSRLINTNSKYKLIAHFSPTGGKIEEKYLPEILTDAGFAIPLTAVERAGPYFDVLELQN